MSDIKLVKTHTLPLAKAKALVTKAADSLAAEYDLASEWHGNTLHFHRSGVDGRIAVTNSEVRVDVKLGLLLKPLKGKIVDRLESEFDRAVTKAKPTAKKKTAAKKTTRARK